MGFSIDGGCGRSGPDSPRLAHTPTTIIIIIDSCQIAKYRGLKGQDSWKINELGFWPAIWHRGAFGNAVAKVGESRAWRDPATGSRPERQGREQSARSGRAEGREQSARSGPDKKAYINPDYTVDWIARTRSQLLIKPPSATVRCYLSN